jgi:hypothetical protein
MVEADNGIGEASGAVEDEAWGTDNDVEGGRGTGMVRCFEDGVDASAAASFCHERYSERNRDSSPYTPGHAGA